MHHWVPNLDENNFNGSLLQLFKENYFVRNSANNITEKVNFMEQVVKNLKDICWKYWCVYSLHQDKTNTNLAIVSLEI